MGEEGVGEEGGGEEGGGEEGGGDDRGEERGGKEEGSSCSLVDWWSEFVGGSTSHLGKKTYFVQLTQGLARNPTCFALIYVARRGTGLVACLGGRGFGRQFRSSPASSDHCGLCESWLINPIDDQ